MSFATISRPATWNLGECLRSLVIFAFRPSFDQAGGDEDDRERRAFIIEMMQAHPEAFQSDLDCQTMAHFYRSKF